MRVLLFLGIFTPMLAFAEPSSGRLPDGRAYRTDADGIQLVDYIAELEVNVEDLKRQVVGLEDELAEKTQLLEQCGSGPKSRHAVSERTLLKPDESSASRPEAAKAPVVSALACAPFVETAQARIRQLEGELVSLQQSLRTVDRERRETAALRGEIEAERVSREDEARLYQAKIQQLESAMKGKSCPQVDCSAELATVTAQCTEQLNTSQGRVLRLEGEIRELQNGALSTAQLRLEEVEIEAANARREHEVAMQRAQREIATLRSALEARDERLVAASAASDRASLRPVTIEAARPESISPARERAVDGMKGAIFSEYNRVRDAVSQRDRLFKEFNSSSARVAFTAAPAVAKSGKSLSQINDAIRAARSMSELAVARRELAEIRGRMNEDMAFMNRMMRKR